MRYVYVKRTRCPVCGSKRLHTYGSRGDQGDGSTLRFTICTTCGERFKLVVE